MIYKCQRCGSLNESREVEDSNMLVYPQPHNENLDQWAEIQRLKGSADSLDIERVNELHKSRDEFTIYCGCLGWP